MPCTQTTAIVLVFVLPLTKHVCGLSHNYGLTLFLHVTLHIDGMSLVNCTVQSPKCKCIVPLAVLRDSVRLGVDTGVVEQQPVVTSSNSSASLSGAAIGAIVAVPIWFLGLYLMYRFWSKRTTTAIHAGAVVIGEHEPDLESESDLDSYSEHSRGPGFDNQRDSRDISMEGRFGRDVEDHMLHSVDSTLDIDLGPPPKFDDGVEGVGGSVHFDDVSCSRTHKSTTLSHLRGTNDLLETSPRSTDVEQPEVSDYDIINYHEFDDVTCGFSRESQIEDLCENENLPKTIPHGAAAEQPKAVPYSHRDEKPTAHAITEVSCESHATDLREEEGLSRTPSGSTDRKALEVSQAHLELFLPAHRTDTDE